MNFYKALNYWVLGGFDGKKDAYQAINEVAGMELDGIELTVGDCLSPDICEAECRKIAKVAKDAGLGLRTLATGFYWGSSLGSADEDERKNAVEFTRKYIRIASALGAETILVVPGAVDVAWDELRQVIPYQTVWNKASDSLAEILPLAESEGINIALENVWNKFLLSPMEMKIFIDNFSSDRIGSYLDVGNTLLNGYPEHWIEILGQRIKAVHFKNFTREDAGGLLHGFGDDLLSGDVNFPAVIESLARYSPGVPVTAEMIPFCRLPDLVLPDMALANSTAAKLKNLGA
jgi:hexulose-6-phosphate isomerase